MARIQDVDIPHLEFAEAAAPGTPASGVVRIYAKTDGKLYQKDDAGTETDLTASGSGAPTDAEYVVTAANGSLSAEKVVTAPASGGMIPQVIRKTADEVVNNSTTLQDDDHLLYALAANEDIEFEMMVWYDTGTTADFKFKFTVPSGASLTWYTDAINAATTASNHNATFTDADTRDAFGNGVGSIRALKIYGFLENGATPGNLQFQWAQNSTQAVDTTVHANSTMKVWSFG